MTAAKTAEKHNAHAKGMSEEEELASMTPEERREHQLEKDREQEERVQNLVDDVREAFTQNQFAIPGDIDTHVRSMANLSPHHELPPESKVGPGVAAERALETKEQREARVKSEKSSAKTSEHSHKK